MTNINIIKRLTRIGVRWCLEFSSAMGIDEGLKSTIDLSDEDARTLWGKLGQGLEEATPDSVQST